MGVRLPAEYQEVEWIECSGGQYLQLDYIPEPTDIVEMVFAKNNVSPTASPENFTLYSAGDGTYQYVTVFNMSPNGIHTYGRYFSNVAADNSSSYSIIPSPTEYTWFKHRSNGTTKAQSCEILETGRPFWISAPQKASTLSGNNTRMQVFKRVGNNSKLFVGRNKHLKVTRNDETIFALVGCYRKADNKPGMYDLVSGTFFTNAGTGDFTVGPDVIDSISPWLVARRRWIMAAASRIIKRIATGVNGVVNFVTKVKKPMKVTCKFTPIQAGTGDPSPSNVRPISGWTGCEITHTGTNLIDPLDFTRGYYINQNGVLTASTNACYSGLLRVKSNTVYKYSGHSNLQGADNKRMHAYDANGAWISQIGITYVGSGDKSYTVTGTTPSNCAFIRISHNVFDDNVQVQEGTATAYESYQGETRTINWQSEAGTVYGGTVTLNEDGSADVTAKWFYGTPNYSALGAMSYSNGGYRNAYNYMGGGAFRDFPESVNHAKIISDKAVRGDFSATNTNPVVMKTAGNYIYFGVKSELLESDDLDGLRAYLVEHAPAICYPLKQQDYIVYHFDSIGQLQSFLGNNTVWHDMNGQITVEYYNYQ